MDEERLQFRLKHLIPKLLTSVTFNNSKSIQNLDESSDNPQEIQLDMTYGKIAGKILKLRL